MKALSNKIRFSTIKSYLDNKFLINLNYKAFSKININNDKSEKLKNDPHEFEIYKKIQPSLGKNPPPEPIPDFYNKILETREEGQYHPTDSPNSIAFAIRNNFPILRESVSAMYRINVNGINYHVFNGARIVSFYIIISKSQWEGFLLIQLFIYKEKIHLITKLINIIQMIE